MSDTDAHGPVDYLVVQFPRAATGAATAEALVDLVSRATVRLYDFAVVEKTDDGASAEVDLTGAPGGPLDELRAFAGARSGLLDAEDLAEAANVLDPGMAAAVILYENAWAAPFVGAALSEGAEVVASNRIPAQQLMDALDALDA